MVKGVNGRDDIVWLKTLKANAARMVLVKKVGWFFRGHGDNVISKRVFMLGQLRSIDSLRGN